jgi:hypothetical protein
MNKVLTITRSGETRKAVIRQMAHDTRYEVGAKFKYGSGRAWVVVAVEVA